uniref:Fucosyltransferase n=1 Tax=Palpitomonas bilix TaxID=652834 RepID=A0A7S3G7V5_9EUKA|mmetsp:Transcript_29004/g.74454  ORF Transcript_29004/g.74454 Transcript_29004/m.74454 type:complete len:502 (+) Transcript_29004:374-1879(+)
MLSSPPSFRTLSFTFLALAFGMVLVFIGYAGAGGGRGGGVETSDKSGGAPLTAMEMQHLLEKAEASIVKKVRTSLKSDLLDAHAHPITHANKTSKMENSEEGSVENRQVTLDEVSAQIETDKKLYPHYLYPPLAHRNPRVYAGRQRIPDDDRKSAINTFFADYVQLHNDIMEGKKERKFVVLGHYTEAGLGNLLPVMVSTFLLAVMTDRAFLVDWPYQRPRQHFNGVEYMGYPDIKELMEAPAGIAWRYDELKKLKSDTTLNIEGVEDSIICNDPSKLSETVLRVKTWDFFGPALFYHKQYHDKLAAVFGDDWYGAMMRWVVRPIPSLQVEIDEFVAEKFAKNFVVGLQIRRKGSNKLSLKQENSFFTCANNVARQQGVEDPYYFIAADNEQSRKDAEKQYGDKAIFFSSTVSRSSTRGVQEGIIDLLLLAHCDDIIGSGGSTYGRTAAGYATVPPVMVMRGKELCIRQLSSLPCMYTPESRQCLANKDFLVNYQDPYDLC